jgi:transcription antitermination factor NusG
MSRREHAREAAGELPDVGRGKDASGRGNAASRAPLKRRRRPKGWSPMSDWVLVRTKTGRENWARLNCEKQAMETWYPRCAMPGKGKLQPVFPGYIFVKPGDKWRSLRSTYGVLEIVMQGDAPQFVPRAVMQALKKQEDADGVWRLPTHKDPEQGDLVEIKIGAWKNHLGVYDGLSPSGRSRVLLEFLSQEIVLEFSRRDSIEVRE